MDLLLSDIHADFDALESILDVTTSKEFISRYGEFSRILCLGDVLERGTEPKLVLKRLLELKTQYQLESVMGNHDEAYLYGRQISGSSFESMLAHSRLGKDELSFFHQNKDGTYGKQQFVDNKRRMICVHGGPLDPNNITPKDILDPWLYQKTWQRISEEDREFFSYSGYHYKPISAFLECKKYLDNFVIFCGHQHIENIIEYADNKTSNLTDRISPSNEKINGVIVTKKEIALEQNKCYIVRLALAGPQGYYGSGMTNPHFGLMDHDTKTVRLFSIIRSGDS